MDATRANLGHSAFPSPAGPTDVGVYIRERYMVLDEVLREPSSDRWLYREPPVESGPFELADFGKRDRLAWPVAACEIPQSQRLVYWAKRFVTWFHAGTLSVIDATRPAIARFDVPELLGRYDSVLVHGGKLWLGAPQGVVSFALPWIEALFDRPPGSFEIRVRETYPARRADRVVRARVTTIGETEASAEQDDVVSTLRFPRVDGLALGMPIRLHDELWPGLFLEIELPDRPRVALYRRVADEHTFAARLAIEPAIDPAGTLAPVGETPSRQSDLDQLFREIADAPDDPATRTVLVDALEDAGERYAPQLAALVAGETDVDLRREALGTLASYLERVEYRGGLPWSAWLAEGAPLDEAIGDIVAADQRLGLFHTLRIGAGPFGVYAKLVGSPRAVGLRHVDVPNARILAALIAAGRRELVQLSSVKFATREMIQGLADPTFDRVATLVTETGAAVVAAQLEFIIRDELGFFARTPRHLVLTERAARDDALVPAVLAAWDRLPLAGVTVAGVVLRRDGTARVTEQASGVVLGQVRARFTVERVTDMPA